MTTPSFTLALVRHGATAWNEGGQWQGWTDNPLGPLGEQQAREAGETLAQWARAIGDFDAVYSSDLRRARQTAELAMPAQEPYLDLRLRELHLGSYEGLSVVQMQQRPDFLPWQADPWQQPVPGGESLREVSGRMQDWLAEVRGRLPGGRVVAFSHSIAIRTLMRDLLHLPLTPQPNYPVPYAERVPNGGVVVLRLGEQGWERLEI